MCDICVIIIFYYLIVKFQLIVSFLKSFPVEHNLGHPLLTAIYCLLYSVTFQSILSRFMRGQQASFLCLQPNSLLPSFYFGLAVGIKKLSLWCDILTLDVRKNISKLCLPNIQNFCLLQAIWCPQTGCINSVHANWKSMCRNWFGRNNHYIVTL